MEEAGRAVRAESETCVSGGKAGHAEGHRDGLKGVGLRASAGGRDARLKSLGLAGRAEPRKL